MHKTLANGCEIVRGHAVEIGFVQTEPPGKPEAWLWWAEGQSLTSDRRWKFGTRDEAIARINVYLGMIGLVLRDNQIVSMYPQW